MQTFSASQRERPTPFGSVHQSKEALDPNTVIKKNNGNVKLTVNISNQDYRDKKRFSTIVPESSGVKLPDVGYSNKTSQKFDKGLKDS